MKDTKTFTSKFYCKNCQQSVELSFDTGTMIFRAPYLGYPNSETRITTLDHKHVTLKCPHCEIGNIA